MLIFGTPGAKGETHVLAPEIVAILDRSDDGTEVFFRSRHIVVIDSSCAAIRKGTARQARDLSVDVALFKDE